MIDAGGEKQFSPNWRWLVCCWASEMHPATSNYGYSHSRGIFEWISLQAILDLRQQLGSGFPWPSKMVIESVPNFATVLLKTYFCFWGQNQAHRKPKGSLSGQGLCLTIIAKKILKSGWSRDWHTLHHLHDLQPSWVSSLTVVTPGPLVASWPFSKKGDKLFDLFSQFK